MDLSRRTRKETIGKIIENERKFRRIDVETFEGTLLETASPLPMCLLLLLSVIISF